MASFEFGKYGFDFRIKESSNWNGVERALHALFSGNSWDAENTFVYVNEVTRNFKNFTMIDVRYSK